MLDTFDCAARLEWYRELFGFRKVGAFNLGVSLERFRRVGGFSADVRDCHIGFLELAYRLYLDGAWFLPAPAWCGDAAADNARYPKALDDFADHCATPWHRKRAGSYRVPKVSIYVPSHNNGRFIVHSVQSALEQDFTDLEICICDDGSTDDTLVRLQAAFGDDSRVRVLATANGGIGWASNRRSRNVSWPLYRAARFGRRAQAGRDSQIWCKCWTSAATSCARTARPNASMPMAIT